MIINVNVPVAQCCYIEVMQEIDAQVQVQEFTLSFNGTNPIHSDPCKLRRAAIHYKDDDD